MPVFVPLAAVVDSPYQPRRHYDPDRLAELARSVLAGGLDSVPKARVVGPDGRPADPGHPAYDLLRGDATAALVGSRVQLAFGHRRCRAVGLAWDAALGDPAAPALIGTGSYAGLRGWPERTVPLELRWLTDESMLRKAVLENRHREDLSAVEEALSMAQAKGAFGYTDDALGELWGYSRSAVSNKLRLLRLPPSVQAWNVDGRLTEGKARALVALADAWAGFPAAARAAGAARLDVAAARAAGADRAEDVRTWVADQVAAVEAEAERRRATAAPLLFAEGAYRAVPHGSPPDGRDDVEPLAPNPSFGPASARSTPPAPGGRPPAMPADDPPDGAVPAPVETIEARFPAATLQALHDAGLNPFAVSLLAESALRAGQRLVDAGRPAAPPVGFTFAVDREDCAAFAGVRVWLEPVARGQDRHWRHKHEDGYPPDGELVEVLHQEPGQPGPFLRRARWNDPAVMMWTREPEPGPAGEPGLPLEWFHPRDVELWRPVAGADSRGAGGGAEPRGASEAPPPAMKYSTRHHGVGDSARAQEAAFRGIRESHVYFALVTRAFVTDAQALAQAEYARELGKPFAVVKQAGVDLPAEFDGAQIVAVEEVDFDGDPGAWMESAQRAAARATKHLGMR